MLTRRSLLGTTAVLAAGCGSLGNPLTPPSAPQDSEIKVAAFTRSMYLSLSYGDYVDGNDNEDRFERALAALEEDDVNAYGPKRGGYSLALRFVEDFAPQIEQSKTVEEAEASREARLDAVAETLDLLEADLVTVWPEEARWWGENGLLLPLDRFSGAGESELNQEFFPTVLNQYRRDGALYALPVDAAPLMLYYDQEFFANQGVPMPDATWDWDDLVRNAVKITTAKQDGSVARWGLVAHGEQVFWALWQNEASLVDMDTRQCRLSDPAAVEALQFVHDLLHKHRVSPLAEMRDLWDYSRRTPPAMLYDYPPIVLNQRRNFRMAALPRGKVSAGPVRTSLGIGIAARTQRTEAAFVALKGFTRAMQEHVAIPAGREAVARLADIRTDISPEEVAAVQHSLEHGREWPQHGLTLQIMYEMTQSLGRGDDVATIVNQACSLAHEY